MMERCALAQSRLRRRDLAQESRAQHVSAQTRSSTRAAVMDAASCSSAWPDSEEPALQAVISAALTTRETGMATVVILPRTRTAVALAREVARRLGTHVTAEIAEHGIKLSFREYAAADP